MSDAIEPWQENERDLPVGSSPVTVVLSREGWRRAHAAIDDALGANRERLALHEALELMAARLRRRSARLAEIRAWAATLGDEGPDGKSVLAGEVLAILDRP